MFKIISIKNIILHFMLQGDYIFLINIKIEYKIKIKTYNLEFI